VPLRHLALVALVVLTTLLSGCGGGGSGKGAQTGLTDTTSAPSAFESLLGELPADEALLQQLLFGDLVRLRRAYPDAAAFSKALRGVLRPDALAGARRPKWIGRYGFGVGNVERFIAGGVDPLDVAIISGTFDPAAVRRRLRHSGYTEDGKLWRHGKDGSVDDRTTVGRLAKSALDRIAVSKGRLVVASTTGLIRGALRGRTSLATNDDLTLAAQVLGPVTAAAIVPRELVRAPAGAAVKRLAVRRSVFLAIGLDDAGPQRRTVRIVLVYPSAAAAEPDNAALRDGLRQARVPTLRGKTYGDVFEGLAVRISGSRAVVVSGRIADPRTWRRLLRNGGLAPLVAA
jgi:hypothetical protein